MSTSKSQARNRPSHAGASVKRWAIGDLAPFQLSYVLAVDCAALLLFVALLRETQFDDRPVYLALLLIGAAALNVEALRRVGEPAGTFSDLQLAWTLPMALLLPPIYAMLAPIPLTVLSHYRIKRTVIYRRVFSTAVICLTNVLGAVVFRELIGGPLLSEVPAHQWLGHPLTYAAFGFVSGIVASLANYVLVVGAVKMSSPETTWRSLLLSRETRLLETVEVCCGVVATVLATVHTVLVVVAIPPMLLLQRSILHGQLNAAARTDNKTGLLNAGAWTFEAERELTTAARSKYEVALLLIDLDHFKHVNDTYGHLIGDQVLQMVASALTDKVRKSDIAGRFGGEEFVLLLPHTGPSTAIRVAERLHGRISGLSVDAPGHPPVRVTVSIGVAQLGPDGSDLMELLAAADTALYRAKSAGRNRTCLATGSVAGQQDRGPAL